jgi:hypothetical protein
MHRVHYNALLVTPPLLAMQSKEFRCRLRIPRTRGFHRCSAEMQELGRQRPFVLTFPPNMTQTPRKRSPVTSMSDVRDSLVIHCVLSDMPRGRTRLQIEGSGPRHVGPGHQRESNPFSWACSKLMKAHVKFCITGSHNYLTAVWRSNSGIRQGTDGTQDVKTMDSHHPRDYKTSFAATLRDVCVEGENCISMTKLRSTETLRRL